MEDLVVEVLSELLYESEVEDLMLCGFRCKLRSSHRIRVSAGGVPTSEVDLEGPPIKAVTYHDVTVKHDAGGWIGRVYFDV
jgi:SHS2 domain-containing protein